MFLRIAGLLLVNLGFWIFGFSDFRFSSKICLENVLVRYRGKNNKGVLDRPWTIWKFWGPFLVHWNVSLPKIMKMKRFYYSVRQNIADPGSIKLRTIFPFISVLSKPPQLHMGSTNPVFYENPVLSFVFCQCRESIRLDPTNIFKIMLGNCLVRNRLKAIQNQTFPWGAKAPSPHLRF